MSERLARTCMLRRMPLRRSIIRETMNLDLFLSQQIRTEVSHDRN